MSSEEETRRVEDDIAVAEAGMDRAIADIEKACAEFDKEISELEKGWKETKEK